MKNLSYVVAHAGSAACLYAMVLALFWAVVSLTYPFGWDQGIFAWVGEGINQGGLPYRDYWEIKGPITYYVYATAQFLFGKNLWGIRLIDLVFVVSAGLKLGNFVSHFTNEIVARWAAILFVLWYASGSFWHTAQPDGWVSMLLLFAFAPLVTKQSDRHWFPLFLAGILIGCCTLIKPIYILFTVVIFALILSDRWSRKGQILIDNGIVLTGLLVPLALFVGWFAYHGALQSMFDVWLIYPLKVYSGVTEISPLSRIKGFVDYFVNEQVISVMLPVMGLGIFSLWRSNKKNAVAMMLWLTVSIFCVVLQNRFFRYHWIVIYPPVVFFCAIGFYELFFQSRRGVVDYSVRSIWPLRAIASMLLVILIVHATVRPSFEVLNWLLFVTNRVTRDQYYAGFGIPGPDLQVADYIRSRTEKEDRIVIWGWNTTILYLSDRKTTSRFGYSMPLIMGAGTREREAYRQEFLDSLYMKPPVYIVVAPQSDVILGGHYDLSNFIELANFVSSRYVEETRFGELVLYRNTER